MDTPSAQERLNDVGATIVAPVRRSPAYLQRFLESDIANNAAPIKAAGISMDGGLPALSLRRVKVWASSKSMLDVGLAGRGFAFGSLLE